MTCAVGSSYQGTRRIVLGSGREADVAIDRVDDVVLGIVAGDRLDEDALRQPQAVLAIERRNFSPGRILPRAMPVMSATMHSTSVIPLLPKPLSERRSCRSLPAARVPAACREGGEQAERPGILGDPPFGMPLDAEHEAGRVPDARPPRSCRPRPAPRPPAARPSRSIPWPCSELTSIRGTAEHAPAACRRARAGPRARARSARA